MKSSASTALECSLCTILSAARLVAEPRRGVKPAYEEYHVIAGMLLMLDSPIGRPSLSKRLGLGDTAAKTMIRRLVEHGFAERVGRSGVKLVDSLREALLALRVCIYGSGSVCIAFNTCRYECSSLTDVLRLRDSLVSVGVKPVLIMCCSRGVEAPGVPRDLLESYASFCEACNGRSLCVIVEDAGDPLLIASRVLYSVASIECGG